MARLTQKSKGARDKRKSTTPSRNALTPQDLVVAGAFLGSIIFALVSFSRSVTPLDETFVVWPLAIGAVAGGLIGWAAHKWKPFESPGFVVGVLAFSGAVLAIGLVLALNRPLDRTPPKHHFVTVVNRYQIGSGSHATYHLEVDGFTLKRLDVDEAVFNGTVNGGQVDILTRPGFFGYPYLERIQLVSLNLPADQSLPAVPPPIPVDDLTGGKDGKQ